MAEQTIERPFFTVVIPTYNRAGLIGKTLDTVLQQSFQDFEILIVDNRSTDNTVEVLQPYLQDKRIRLQVQEQNYERSRSRNKGMELARGRFLTFLDSDDWLYQNALELAHAYALANPGSDFFHHRYESRDMENRLVYSYSFPRSYRHAVRKLMLANFLSCIGVYISDKIYHEYRFDENRESLGSEDWDFWIRVASQYPLGAIPEVAAAIVQHDERTVQQNRVPALLARKKYYLDKYRKDPVIRQRLGKQLPIFEAGFDLYTATVAYQSRNFGQGFRFALKALAGYPSCIGSKFFWKILLSPLKQLFRK